MALSFRLAYLGTRRLTFAPTWRASGSRGAAGGAGVLFVVGHPALPLKPSLVCLLYTSLLFRGNPGHLGNLAGHVAVALSFRLAYLGTREITAHLCIYTQAGRFFRFAGKPPIVHS